MDLWFCGNTTNGSTTLKDSWFPLRWPQEEDGCRVDAINIVIAFCTGCVALVTNIFHRTISRRWRVSRIHWGLSTLREMLWLLLLLVHLVEMGDALLGRWMLHALLTPITSLLAWVLWLPLHRVSYSWVLRLLGFTAFFASAASRFLRVVQLVNLPLDWSHMRLHASAWAGGLLLAMATIELYSTCRTVCDKDLKWEGPKNANEAETVQSYKYASANLYSKATFFWLTPLLWVGYTSPLELQDLGQLPKEEKTEHQFKKFNDIYTSEQLTAGRKGRKVSLWWCYFRSCWKMFALGGLLKLMGDCVGFVGPLGISVVISYVTILRKSGIIQQEYPTVSEFLNNGYVMGAIVFVAALVHGTFSQSSTHLVNVTGIHLKVALQALVYNKALRLCICNIDDHREDLTSNHEDEKPAKVTGLPGSKKMVEHKYHSVQSKDSFSTDMGTITNLMSEDVYNVMSFFWIGHYVWAIPLKIGVLMYLLYHKLGVSAIIGAAFCILTMTPLQFLIGKKMSANSKAVTDVSDQRLRQMNEVLQGIRLLKLYGWECLYGDRILLTRAKELKLLDKDSFYWAVMIFLTHASSILVTLVTFGVYFLLEARPLTPENVFSGLALFNQLTVPLFIFPITVPIIISAMVSTNRLEKFLDLPETCSVMPASCNSDQQPETETETVHREVTALSPNYSERVVENNTLSYTEDGESIVKARAERADSVFGLGDILEQETENEETVDDTEREEEEVRNVRNPEANGEVAVAVEGGKFSWSVDTGKPMLNLSHIVFPSGKLTVIVGRVGSGKSSLLSALLGEMPRLDGKVKWTIGSVIGYASQKPWLLNATMRENILFGQPFRPRRYGRIIEACSLQPDIDILPGKDLTEIGEKGINLSGGQKQRIAVARALYSQANVVILDDPLSALDYHVGQKLVDSGIRRLLLRQKRTVILVTHRLQLLAHAHQIIALEGGSVRAQGSLTEIEANDRELVRTWRAAMSREALEEKRNARSEAARDRWQLLKLVSRIGVQLKQRNIVDGTWKTDEEAHVTPPVFLPLRRRQGTFSGSRYFTHDLPLPMDECEAEFLERTRRTSGGSGRLSLRHRSRAATTTETPGVMKQKSSLLRASSLQAGRTVVHGDTCGKRSLHLSTIVRQSSSPSVQNSQNAPDINCRSQVFTGPDNSGQPSSLLRRIFSIRTQRSSSVATLAMSDHGHTKRLPSTASGGSDDIDDDDPYSEVTDAQTGRLLSEEREYGKIPKRIYLQYLRACSVCVGTGYLASTFVWQGLRVYTDYWLNQWTNSGNTGNSTVPHMWDYEMKYYLLVYGALSVVSVLLSLSSNGIGQYAGARARQVLHENMLRNIIRCPLRFFESTPVGRIINRFSTDMSVIDKKIATSIQRLLQFLLLCFSAIIVNAVVTPWFLIAAVPICIVYFAIQRFYRCSARELQRLDSITRSPILSHFSETLGGLITIRAFGHQMRFQSLLFNMVDTHTSAFLIMNTSNRWLGIALDYLGGVIVFTSVVAALLTARMYPDVTSSLVGLAVNYTLLVPIYLNWVVMFLADMEMYMGAVERVQQYAHIPTEDYCLQGITVPRSWPQNGDIVFEDVSLCYDTSRGPIISNLNLHIPAGQKVGICGRSGSGKSSLVMSLFHMVDIFEGKILIDGVDIKLVPLQVLRSRLSVIPQDVIMFSGTIRENLDPQSQYSDIELWKSLELAQLKDFVSNLPGCLDAEVREGGENLSAGERQLFCLARAILHNAACLVMDEATSSVDPSTEKALLAAATRAFAGKTVITIAHRLSTILDYDRILVLESGRIMEDGSPTQLRHRSMGIFSSMLRASQEETPFTKNEQGSQELIVNKFRGKRL